MEVPRYRIRDIYLDPREIYTRIHTTYVSTYVYNPTYKYVHNCLFPSISTMIPLLIHHLPQTSSKIDITLSQVLTDITKPEPNKKLLTSP